MSVNENCLFCPARQTCAESIKFYTLENGGSMMITRTPVICPGPDQLVKIIDDNGTRESFGATQPQRVLSSALGAKLLEALEAPTLTVVPEESRMLIVCAEADSPTAERAAIPAS